MARRRRGGEEGGNHEAWAIPYADLLTLLLAFFVVMYALSSINEGKYRVLADSLSSAFGGPPRTINPIQFGQSQLRGSAFDRPSLQTAAAKAGPAAASPINAPRMLQVLDVPTFGHQSRAEQARVAAEAAAAREVELQSLGRRIQEALSELVRRELVTVRRGAGYLEVEIQSDILFASGVATPSPLAVDTVQQLAQVLRDEPNALRVEGYTDNVPIANARFPSNWELSAARATSVMHELIAGGIAPQRLAIVGFGEYQPVADNATAEGRNANRRVLLVILAAPQGPDAVPAAGMVATATAPVAVPPDPPGPALPGSATGLPTLLPLTAAEATASPSTPPPGAG